MAFLNPANKAPEEINQFLKDHLIEGEWFYEANGKFPIYI